MGGAFFKELLGTWSHVCRSQLLSVADAGQKGLVSSHTGLFEKKKNVPCGVATRLPSTDPVFGGFEVGCGNFTAFFDANKLLQSATNVKKTKGV